MIRISTSSTEDQIAQVPSACPECREPRTPSIELAFSGGPDLLFGEKIWAALLAEVPDLTTPLGQLAAMEGVSVGVCSYLDPNVVAGCSEVGRRIVQDMQEEANHADDGNPNAS